MSVAPTNFVGKWRPSAVIARMRGTSATATPPATTSTNAAAAATTRNTAAGAAKAPQMSLPAVLARLDDMPSVRQAVRGAHLPAEWSPERFDRVEQALAHGKTGRAVNGISAEGNENGVLPIFNVRHGAERVTALRKTAEQQAAQEDFGYHLAREVGVGHRVARVARRDDGSVLIEKVGGTMAHRDGVPDMHALERVLADDYAARFPEMSAAEVAKLARIERQLLQFVDYVAANADRRGTNIMSNKAAHELHYIDWGDIGRHQNGTHPLRPLLDERFVPARGKGAIELDPETLAIIRQRFPAERLAPLMERLGKGLSFGKRSGERHHIDMPVRTYREQATQRYEHALAHAELPYESHRKFG